MNLYPLLMAPSFRHGEETPWGGHMLRDALLKDAPEDAVGESLEISDLPGHESMVANGPHAGKSLSRMIELWGDDLTGPTGGDFPLLLKLLDPVLPLSVQVHPDDAYAAAHENGKRGKTEAWIILNAEPGSQIIYGADTNGERLDKLVSEGRLKEGLRFVNVRPGDVYYIPSGMLHALCEGVMVYEIQQSSDVTYRFYDWGRTDSKGNKRELHIDKALDVVDLSVRQEKAVSVPIGPGREQLLKEKYFSLQRWQKTEGTLKADPRCFRILTALGETALFWEKNSMTISAGQTVLLPARGYDLSIRTEEALISYPTV